MSREIITKYPGDASCLETASDVFFAALRLQEFMDIQRRIVALELREMDKKGEMAVTAAQERGLSDDYLSERVEFVTMILAEHGLTIPAHQTEFLQDEMRIVFRVPCSLDKVVDVNFEIAERITARFEDTAAEFVTFSCIPVPTLL